ncbi:DUF6352 family protein [Afipia felis]|uniref:Uncharacterized protein n=2 Tax=Afipia felis TaxID=1035 RepID=A0A380W563_AFIFE|nr:DUF6352 family protein [Afipia felis]EKS31253.1 hypothetical protein HMPREF9697_03781 [Afipia felis ATCC 53690]SUU75995.1 Uncharacterised protein [Afipia felis]SUU84062.1 Uncharacterised protein [Afipia felis]
MKDFWISCGHHLLDQEPGGGLVATDEFLKAYFIRPELMPPAEACQAERQLHAALLAQPRRPVDANEVSAIVDPDARENWQFVLAFRELLLSHPTLEAAYLALMRGGAVALPPLFVSQLTHVILRNALNGCDDPFVLRAGELFFRPQRVTANQGSLLAVDEEWIGGENPVPTTPLLALLEIPEETQIDILDEENTGDYWQRSDMFDMGLDLSAGGRGTLAVAEVMRRWIAHLLAIDVIIEPLAELRDATLTWYVGLDSEATAIGNRLWNGEELDDQTAGRVAGLFRLTFSDDIAVSHGLENEPIYLIMATTPERILRMKPQNLITGLPIKHLEATS